MKGGRNLLNGRCLLDLGRQQNMDARPLLDSVVAALAEARLEAILIGNAAAAMQGAPVTTVDFDFMFRPTPVNLAKLKSSPSGWTR